MVDEKKTIIIATDALSKHTRASKVAKTLTQRGYSVTFLGWERGWKHPAVEQWRAGDAPREILLKLKSPSYTNTLVYYPIWWCFTFFHLMMTKWDIAYAINFDSVPPAAIAGKLKRKPVIYEMLDTYEDSVSLPKVIRSVCVKIDKLFMRLVSSVVLADEMQIEEVGGIPNSRVVAVYDSPPDFFGGINFNHQRNDVFTLFFGGILNSTKVLNLDKMFMAVEGIEGIKIIIAGYGDLVEEIKGWSRKMPDMIQFIGSIDHAEVLKRSAEADILFILRSPVLITNEYICGSKVLEAMMCGRPIIVNKGTSTANKVREENCGLVVDANNIKEIREAIIKLRDSPELCNELGTNARKAYEERYGWGVMEQRLADLCHELTGGVD